MVYHNKQLLLKTGRDVAYWVELARSTGVKNDVCLRHGGGGNPDAEGIRLIAQPAPESSGAAGTSRRPRTLLARRAAPAPAAPPGPASWGAARSS
jgi:hypothetical protein